MAITYKAIATQTLGSATASITFSSIPATYTDLVLVANAGDTANAGIYMQFNGDTGTNYSYTRLTGDGSSGTSQKTSTTAKTYVMGANLAVPSSVNGMFQLNIMNYANTTTYKTTIGTESIAAAGVVAKAFLWRSTSAITSILIADDGGNLLTNSTFTLYGIKAA
jgi:hypothetical protein